MIKKPHFYTAIISENIDFLKECRKNIKAEAEDAFCDGNLLELRCGANEYDWIEKTFDNTFIFITLGGNKDLWKNKRFDFIRVFNSPKEERNKKELNEIIRYHRNWNCSVKEFNFNNDENNSRR